MSSATLFEANKPRKTHQAIKELIVKYEKIVNGTLTMDKEDCFKIEMAKDFSKELKQVMKIFKSGE
ncbi:MAG TPA: hypothetical protein EYG21_01530 [Nitrospinaceae bacterium]|nr:hypothetical protein [Nitrospinaceae bacterium]